MMLKVSGLPPEMAAPALRRLIQDSCALSYVMVEEFNQGDSSSSRSAVVACPNDHDGAKVLQKLHGMLIGSWQLNVEPLFQTDDPTDKYPHVTPAAQYESSPSKDYRDRSPINKFQDSGQSSKNRDFRDCGEGIPYSSRSSPCGDGKATYYRDYSHQLKEPNCDGLLSRQQQHVHNSQNSDFVQVVTPGNSTLQKVSPYQEPHGFMNLENVQDFLQAAEKLLKVSPRILEIAKSQTVQKSSSSMPGAQTNMEFDLAPKVAQTTYQIAKFVQEIQSTQHMQHMLYQNLNQFGFSHSASHSATIIKSQQNNAKIHGIKASFQTEGKKDCVTSTDDSTMLNGAVYRVLYNLLNSKPKRYSEKLQENEIIVNDKLPDQYANESYESIIKKLKNQIRIRINNIQSFYHSNSEKNLYKIYCKQHPGDIIGHLSQIGSGKEAILGTAKKKLLVDLMLIETPWLEPIMMTTSTRAQRLQFQRRKKLDAASNWICLCVLKMPPAPTKNASMPKLALQDKIVFDHFKVDMYKKLDAYCKTSYMKAINSRNVAASFLLKSGNQEVFKCVKDAITFYNENSHVRYSGIFNDDIKPNYSILVADKIVKRKAHSIAKEILSQNTTVVNEMKQSCESVDKERYEETIYNWVHGIVTKRIRDFIAQLTSLDLVEEYWKRYPNNTEVCVMANEQLKSGGNEIMPSEAETFANSIDDFLSEINEMIDSDASQVDTEETETTVTR